MVILVFILAMKLKRTPMMIALILMLMTNYLHSSHHTQSHTAPSSYPHPYFLDLTYDIVLQLEGGDPHRHTVRVRVLLANGGHPGGGQ